MALKKARRATLPATLTLTGQGETVKFDITYNNCKQSELDAVMTDPEKDIADAVLFVVKDWDTEYELTKEGLAEMEDDRPGTVMAVIQGFHDARRVAKAKN